ncbi:MAG: FKBP-type peptidyl-prolyl cis-trans isomerase [Pauljensenia sp.]
MTAPRTRRATHAPLRRRWPLLLAATLVVLVVAAAATVGLWVRSGDILGQSSSQSAAQSGSVLDRVAVSGRPGATPAITVTSPLEVSGVKYREMVTGTGRTITEGSPVVLAITAFDGADGTILSPDARPRTTAGLAGSGEFDDLLDRAVTGRNEGSRLLFVRSITDPEAESGSGSGEVRVEIDVVDILPSVADGEAVEIPAESPVTVTLGDDGPMVSHEGAAPDGTTTQLLLRGSGAQVRSGDMVLAQFTITGWSDGEVRESTWDTGLPRAIDLSTAMPGLVEALVDQRVGSRLVVTIPPELATGDDTLIVVVDVLGTSPGTS